MYLLPAALQWGWGYNDGISWSGQRVHKQVKETGSHSNKVYNFGFINHCFLESEKWPYTTHSKYYIKGLLCHTQDVRDTILGKT